jgi:N-acetylmuramoyl-L-alanine amidase
LVWHSEDDTHAFATHLAARMQADPALGHAYLELHGALGAGKTTLVRHLLRALGVTGRIKSPTYAVVEPHQAPGHAGGPGLAIWHFDFYRFTDPREWEDAGFRDLFASPGLKLAEWPAQAAGMLPTADVVIDLDTQADDSRIALCCAQTATGRALLEQLPPPTQPAPPLPRTPPMTRTPEPPPLPCCATQRAVPGIARRSLLQTGALTLLLGPWHLARGATIVAVRIWPAPDYSRVTLESDTELKATQVFIPVPPRLAVDIEGLELSPALRELVAKVQPGDPNIAGIRVGQYAPNVVRLVVDLKQAIRPQMFTLAPVAAYKHRLVFDFYPTHVIDPLQALVAERGPEITPPAPPTAAASAAQPATSAAAAATPGASAPITNDPLGELITRQNQRDDVLSAILPPLGTGAAKPASPAPRPTPTPSTRRYPEASSAPDQALMDLVASRNLPDQPKTEGKASSKGNKTVLSGTERLIIIALDPGHGGEDPGAVGPSGTREKDVVLQIAHRLRERINSTTLQGSPMRAYMTRDADFFVPLRMRVQKAQSVQADLFISLHADAFTNQQARGASVFALSQGAASSEAARWMANQENKADLIGGVNSAVSDPHLQRTLFDMSTTAQIKDSLNLGSAMLRQIGQVGKLHKGSVEQAGFAVLKAPDIPSVLVETAFISNPEEEEKLKTDTYQIALVDALMKGIESYFQRKPPLARNRML